MQQMVLDVTGKTFPGFMQEAGARPSGMKASSFEQPLPAERAKLAATGHLSSRDAVKGRWHIYPEMAAAGCGPRLPTWPASPSASRRPLSGKSAKTLSPEMARQMLTEQKDGMGLGLVLYGSGPTMQFSHGGRDEGFDAVLIAYAETGQGAVIMINANDNSGMVGRLMDAIAKEYRWPDFPAPKPLDRPSVQVGEDKLERYAGRYEFANNQMRAFTVHRGHLFSMADGLPDEEIVAIADDQFLTGGGEVQLTFSKARTGRSTGIFERRDRRADRAPRRPSIPCLEAPGRSRSGEDGEDSRRTRGPRGGRPPPPPTSLPRPSRI